MTDQGSFDPAGSRRTYVFDARTATAHFPGIGRYVGNLVPALAAQLAAGETLVVLRPTEQGAGSSAMPTHPRVRYVAAPASPFGFAQQWQLPRLLRQVAAEVAPAPLVYHSPYYLMPYGVRLPTVLTFYDLIPLRYPDTVSRRARLLFRLTLGMALRTATRVVAISETARQDLLAAFALPPAKVTTTPLAADPRFRPQGEAEIAAVRARYDLPADFVLYLGINKPHKNLVALVEAFAQVQATMPDAVLVLAGPWDDRYPEAREAAQTLASPEGVRFVGRMDDADLPALYAASTAFVFPSRYEGFGLPVLEAMACGTPVACSNVSSLPEVAGDAALTFDPDCRDGIAETMLSLLRAPALRADLRARGLAQAARFQWQQTAAATLAVYRQV